MFAEYPAYKAKNCNFLVLSQLLSNFGGAHRSSPLLLCAEAQAYSFRAIAEIALARRILLGFAFQVFLMLVSLSTDRCTLQR
jgi:hypothetical protein